MPFDSSPVLVIAPFMGISAVSLSETRSESLVTAVVFGYFKVDKRNNIIDAVDVDNPPVVIHTRGMWLDVPLKALEILSAKRYNIAASIHAAEHAVLSLFPNVVVTSPGDVRTECKAPQKEYAQVCHARRLI
jgi:DEAD/DEAH box helicase domain-containing protein